MASRSLIGTLALLFMALLGLTLALALRGREPALAPPPPPVQAAPAQPPAAPVKVKKARRKIAKKTVAKIALPAPPRKERAEGLREKGEALGGEKHED